VTYTAVQEAYAVAYSSSDSPSLSSSPALTVAIIGGGFSGTTLAAKLLHDDPEVSVVVIERFSLPGRGIAYGTQFNMHLLNVQAREMSAFPDDPEHFVRWAKANYDAFVQPGDYLPRRVYGQYLGSLLGEVRSPRLDWRQDEVVSISQVEGKAELRLRSGPKVVADKVVLAVGNFRPGDPALPGKPEGSKRYVPFAWSYAGLENIEQEQSVLLIGSGLTSVDLVLALRARDYTGTIHILSRHGMIPEWDNPSEPWPNFWNETSPRTVRGLLHLIREQVRMATEQGNNWRAVINALRPVTQQIWRSLPDAERRRFLRHLQPYWNVHRHRVSPKIGGLMLYQVLENDLQIHAGKAVGYREYEDGVEIKYRDRHSHREECIYATRIINCTGPETDCRQLDDPMIQDLRAKGLARPDSLFLGLDVDENGALLDSDGLASDFLFVVGPPRKGQLWETTAVPEIRVQVAELAGHLLGADAWQQSVSSASEQQGLQLG
jgi:uncharacterized NAD(P)/FAD-binding protein YdhS